jgi:hypothetical protein
MYEKRHIIEARFFCLLMLHRYTKKTLEQIGEVSKEYQRFRALNHATVLHGIRKVQGEIDIYTSFKRTYEQLKRSIETAPEPMVIEEIDLLSMCFKTGFLVMAKLGYTFYPKDWGNSEAVFELNLTLRGLL